MWKTHLHKDIYHHKTTRGMEWLLQIFLDRLIREVDDRGGAPVAGLDKGHPLLRFFEKERPDDLEAYRALDDSIVWGALHAVAAYRETSPGGRFVVDIARRILERDVPACIDVAKCFPVQSDQRITFQQKMQMRFESSLGKTIFFDARCLSPYEDIGADVAKRHKRLLIQLPNGDLQEITELPDSIFENLNLETPLERYYFLDKGEHEEAEKLVQQLA